MTFYDIPEARSKRAAAFGYGTKYDFTKGKPKTPAPNAYISGGVFEDKKRGFSMGLGRDVREMMISKLFLPREGDDWLKEY